MKILKNKTHSFFALILLTFFSITSCSQNKKVELGQILNECKKEPSIDCQKMFFENFPKNFADFQKKYGYDDIKGEAQYYSNSEEHLSFFFNFTKSRKNDVFIEKLIGICKEGKWDADSVNSFQSKTRDYFFKNSTVFLSLLKDKQKNDIYGFWYFFSDGPQFNEKVSSDVLKLLKNEKVLKHIYLDVVKKVKIDNIH